MLKRNAENYSTINQLENSRGIYAVIECKEVCGLENIQELNMNTLMKIQIKKSKNIIKGVAKNSH